MAVSNLLSGDTASTVSFDRISHWVQECSTHHTSCADDANASLPTRLIDVTPIEHTSEHGVRLVETGHLKGTPYICLSHCWGTKSISAMTTLDTVHKYKSFIPWNRLPLNFQHAMEITRKLGVRYIWIDSLCIIQKNTADWERESSKMVSIYRNSFLTIAVTQSPDSQGGCFSKSKPDLCFRLMHPRGDNTVNTVLGVRTFREFDLITTQEKFRDQFPLFTRAWCFQERLLSRRVLQCNYREFTFDCSESSRCECSSRHLASHFKPRMPLLPTKAKYDLLLKTGGRRIARVGKDERKPYSRWRSVVEAYSLLHMTNSSDALPALSGLAREMIEITKDTYIAGLWLSNIDNDLLWYGMEMSRNHPFYSPKPGWRAPSWSWASISSGMGVRYLHPWQSHFDRPLGKKIQSVRYELASEDITGGVKSAELQILTSLGQGYIRKFCQKAPHSHRKLKLHVSNMRSDRTSDFADIDPKCQFMDGEEGIDLRDGLARLWSDFRFSEQHEWLKFRDHRDSISCPWCALAVVYLLHIKTMAEKGDQNSLQDVFMVLARDPSNRQTYVRVGLLQVESKDLAKRNSWFKEIWEERLLPETLISII
jgi:hypothetical protein